VLPVYIFQKKFHGTLQYGFPKTDSYRAQFIIESVTCLQNQLQSIGGNLLIEYDDAEHVFEKLLEQNSIDAIYFSKEYALEELQTQQKVAAVAKLKNCEMISLEVATLINEKDLPFTIDQLPNTFTSFRNEIEKHILMPEVYTAPTKITCVEIKNWGSIPTLLELGLHKKIVDNRASFSEKGGEINALDFFNTYVWKKQLATTYFETRNELIGTNYSTKLSAWLACGCISPRFVWQQIQAFELKVTKNKSTYWIFFELLWRDFFRLQFAKHKQAFFLLPGFRKDKIVPTTFHPKYFQQWINGETGVEFVDANMRELKATGFMSNRGRQNVASYLVNDLKMNWLAGAAYFESILIDYDVYSNYGNWSYLAGVGNDPRQDRYFNIEKQTKMYDANGEYRKLWLQ
jgi:deoxyribodipyrimidine photo-lyase